MHTYTNSHIVCICLCDDRYLAEAGCIASGLGFNGVKKNSKGEVTGYVWDRCSNVNALGVETGFSFPHLTNNWNLGVNNWLKNCNIHITPLPHRRVIVLTLLPMCDCVMMMQMCTSVWTLQNRQRASCLRSRSPTSSPSPLPPSGRDSMVCNRDVPVHRIIVTNTISSVCLLPVVVHVQRRTTRCFSPPG